VSLCAVASFASLPLLIVCYRLYFLLYVGVVDLDLVLWSRTGAKNSNTAVTWVRRTPESDSRVFIFVYCRRLFVCLFLHSTSSHVADVGGSLRPADDALSPHHVSLLRIAFVLRDTSAVYKSCRAAVPRRAAASLNTYSHYHWRSDSHLISRSCVFVYLSCVLSAHWRSYIV